LSILEEKFLRIEKRLTVDAFPTQFIVDIEPGSQEFCQCCLKSFVRSRFLSQNETKYPIDAGFKDEVLDVVGVEVSRADLNDMDLMIEIGVGF
jgi:hypothetical protein